MGEYVKQGGYEFHQDTSAKPIRREIGDDNWEAVPAGAWHPELDVDFYEGSEPPVESPEEPEVDPIVVVSADSTHEYGREGEGDDAKYFRREKAENDGDPTYEWEAFDGIIPAPPEVNGGEPDGNPAKSDNGDG